MSGRQEPSLQPVGVSSMGASSRLLLIWFGVLLVFCALFWVRGEAAQRRLILGHNLSEDHPVHEGLVAFQKKLLELSGGRLKVLLYANGQLGPERDVLELIQLGAVAMTKVSSMNLESFAPEIAVFNLPYIFRDKAHYFKVLDGPIGEKMLRVPVSKLLRGLTFYDAGARSFYGRRVIRHPRDLKGLKIRVMGSQTAIRMVKLMGGAPTPMPYGEIYTGLQQGVIDGAENNMTALTLGRHGEVSKHFSISEHTMLPDILIISEKIWQSFSPKMRSWVKKAADFSKKIQRRAWKKEIDAAFRVARDRLKMKIIRPDKAPFVQRVKSMHEALAKKGKAYRVFLEEIEQVR